MQQWTLDEMITEAIICADEVKKAVKISGVYSGDALTIVKKLVTGMNYAKDRIAEKLKTTYKESVTLDNTLIFDINTLSKTFYSVVKISNSNDDEIKWEYVSTSQIKCPYNLSGDAIYVTYEYKPDDFDVNVLTTTLDFPLGAVNPRTLCYYAAYFYLSQGSDDISWTKADFYLQLWNDGLESINNTRGKSRQVRDIRGW